MPLKNPNVKNLSVNSKGIQSVPLLSYNPPLTIIPPDLILPPSVLYWKEAVGCTLLIWDIVYSTCTKDSERTKVPGLIRLCPSSGLLEQNNICLTPIGMPDLLGLGNGMLIWWCRSMQTLQIIFLTVLTLLCSNERRFCLSVCWFFLVCVVTNVEVNISGV